MSPEIQMDAVDNLAAQVFIQRLGAWVASGRQDRIKDTEVNAAATKAYQKAEAFMKVGRARKD